MTATRPPAAPRAERVEASFRDPSGFVFTRDGTVYRQVNASFAAEFDACTASGLYDALERDRLLIPHRAADLALALTPDAHAVLAPERVPFISYPYEWCFGELRDAALLTLDVQVRALERGFTLRDASAYNVQFVDGRPVFIDTLSFAPYRDGEPWAAYKQFCEHFLLPLTLMATRDVRCGLMLRDHLDGIPLDLGSALLPRRTWADFRTLLHVHLHARSQRKHHESKVTAVVGTRRIEKPALLALIGTLRTAVERLAWQPAGTQWADYVGATNYSDAAEAAKRALVIEFVAKADSQVQRLLRNRADVFPSYTREGFEQAFGQHFTIEATERVGDAERWLYLLTARAPGHTPDVS